MAKDTLTKVRADLETVARALVAAVGSNDATADVEAFLSGDSEPDEPEADGENGEGES